MRLKYNPEPSTPTPEPQSPTQADRSGHLSVVEKGYIGETRRVLSGFDVVENMAVDLYKV